MDDANPGAADSKAVALRWYMILLFAVLTTNQSVFWLNFRSENLEVELEIVCGRRRREGVNSFP